MPYSQPDNCRLCLSETKMVFRATILGRYDVAYFRCLTCGCMQTERPHWLDEAYRDGDPHPFDTGTVQRGLEAQAICHLASRLLLRNRASAILDYGGGTGLLCRLLRDLGHDCRTFDPHSTAVFSREFRTEPGARADMVAAIEVFEHLIEPRATLEWIKETHPKLLLVRTQILIDPDPDWPYLSLDTGQHIFLFSADGMAYAARFLGYRYWRFGDLHVFIRPDIYSSWRILLFAAIVCSPLSRLYRGWTALTSTYRHAARDSQALMALQRSRSNANPNGEQHQLEREIDPSPR